MELDKFVSETLVAISRGVEVARVEGEEKIEINPMVYGKSNDELSITRERKMIQSIDFDVALTVEDTAEGGGKISVFGSNVGGNKGNKETLTSRVSFSVPVAFK